MTRAKLALPLVLVVRSMTSKRRSSFVSLAAYLPINMVKRRGTDMQLPKKHNHSNKLEYHGSGNSGGEIHDGLTSRRRRGTW